MNATCRFNRSRRILCLGPGTPITFLSGQRLGTRVTQRGPSLHKDVVNVLNYVRSGRRPVCPGLTPYT